MRKGTPPLDRPQAFSLRSFYRYLAKTEVIEVNHFSSISSPRVDKKLPAYFYEEEIDELFNAIDVDTLRQA